MTIDGPRKAVFDTPELLENIISFLPATVILTKVQRLSRTWKAAVDSSPDIRTKLWLPTQGNTAVQPASFSDEHTFPHGIDDGTLTIPMYSQLLVLNPFVERGITMKTANLKSYVPLMILYDSMDTVKCGTMVQFYGIAGRKPRANRPAIGPSDTWRDMHMTDPPITTAKLDVRYSYKEGGKDRMRIVYSAIRDHGGITLGLMYDMCLASVPLDIQELMISDKEFLMGTAHTIYG